MYLFLCSLRVMKLVNLIKTKCSKRPYLYLPLALSALVCCVLYWHCHRDPYVGNLIGNITNFEVSEMERSAMYIVPNVIHMLHFGKPDLVFVEVVSIRAAYLNQKPDKIMIHCDCHRLRGKYWDMVKDIDIIEIRFKRQPKYIFGKLLDSVFHASDVARLEIMMKFGGIYIDTDVYIVSSLDAYRNMEFSIGWPENAYLGTQVLVAHKNARFLKLWYQSYKFYIPERWYYNAGELPTTHILERMPSLVNRVTRDFGVHDLVDMLYYKKTDEWKTFKTIHLLIRHLPNAYPIKEFDEENIKTYDKTFGEMARLVLYGKSDIMTP